MAFRRLVPATAAATFVLIVVGGVVRVSDSGLGCGPGGSGLHGWPFCKGNVVPGIDFSNDPLLQGRLHWPKDWDALWQVSPRFRRMWRISSLLYGIPTGTRSAPTACRGSPA